MITVLSLNTAVDRILVVPGFGAGEVYHAERALICAGGKGLNVARVVRRLGEPVQVVGFLGGAPERLIQGACVSLGIEQRWIKIERETRTCVTVVDPRSKSQTVVNEAGPVIGPREIDSLRAELLRSVHRNDMLCISGSAPPGVPVEFYAEIVREMRRRGVLVLVDVSGAALRLCGAEHPWALAPNDEESAAAFDTPGRSPEEQASSKRTPRHPPDSRHRLADVRLRLGSRSARRLACSADHALLTLGAEGVIYARQRTMADIRLSGDADHGHRGQEMWHVHPPRIESVNAVGSGDAFVAGFLVGMVRGHAPHDAVRLGCACGASNAARLEPDIGPPEEIERLLGETRAEAAHA